MGKIAFYLPDSSFFGLFCAFCIDNGFNLSGAFWSESDLTECYSIDFSDHRVYHADFFFYASIGVDVYIPKFDIVYGKVCLNLHEPGLKITADYFPPYHNLIAPQEQA